VRIFAIGNRPGEVEAHADEQAVLPELINLKSSDFNGMINSILSLDGELDNYHRRGT
jgi:hypothetical protein